MSIAWQSGHGMVMAMEIEPLLASVMQTGFPAVVAIYLLVRFEAKLDTLADVINDLKCSIDARYRD